MAHVAQLDENNIVMQVIVVSNDYEPNVEQFAIDLFGGVWKQTSYNATFRKNYAGINFAFDELRDAFIPPKFECHENQVVLNEETCQWYCENEEHNVTE